VPVGPGFITNRNGDTLDKSKIYVPDGKLSYLLYGEKGHLFHDIMGYNEASLEESLIRHLIENFANAGQMSEEKPDGVRVFNTTGPMIGANGFVWKQMRTSWAVHPDGSVSFVTSFPER
jgi:hypothetical protein